MNFAVFDDRIDALWTKLASAREQDDTQMLADELAHIIWLRAEIARRIVQVGGGGVVYKPRTGCGNDNRRQEHAASRDIMFKGVCS